MSNKKEFKKGSAFKDDKRFKYENSLELNKEEIEDIKKTPDIKKKSLLEKIVDEKDKNFVDVMEDDLSAKIYVEGVEREKIKKAHDQKEEAKNYVDMASGYDSYRVNAAEYGMWLLMHKEIPDGFEYHCVPTRQGNMNIYGRDFETKDGIVFVLRDPKGQVYIKAMRCTYLPDLDIEAISKMSLEVENTVDYVQGSLVPMNENKDEKFVRDIVNKYGKSISESDPKRD